MKLDGSKAHLNLSINPEYVKIFSKLDKIHGMTLSGFLESKLKELFQEIAPDKLIDLEIEEVSKHLAELEENRRAIIRSCENLRELQNFEKAKKEHEAKSDDKWIERFNAYQSSNITMVNRRDQEFFKKAVDWGFKSASEANEKITDYVKSLGCYGCKVCKKWNPRSQHCSQQNRKTDDQFSCRSWEKK